MAPPSTVRGLVLLTLATLRSILLLIRLRPRVTFATGGYASVPAVLASWVTQVPIVLFLPDVVPGKAVSRLAPLASRIAVTTQASVERLSGDRVVVTGYPVREQVRAAAADRGLARGRFDVPVGAPVLCVFGGSQGARAINEALGRALPEILKHYYVIHVAGEKRFPEAERAASGLSQSLRARYRLVPYLHDEDMAAALAAADLALCRSGASTLGELPAAGLPAILVPLPDPAVHQRENAEVLVAAGAAVTVDERDLDARLVPLLAETLGDRGRLAAMSASARLLDRPDAIDAIARLVLATAAP